MNNFRHEAASTEEQYGSPTYAWYVVVILLFAYVTSFLDRTILTLLVEPIRESLNITDLQLSLLHGFAFAVFYVSLGVPIARYADSHNRVKLISAGVLVWSVMTAFCGLARNFTHMFLARVGVGIGEATLSPAAYSIISDYFPVEKRPRAFSVYQTGIYVGMGLAMIIGGYVIAVVPSINMPFYGPMEPWQVVFLLVGLPGLLFTLTIIASGLVELIGWKSFRAPMPVGYGLKGLLDIEGRVHRMLYVNCSCCGTSPTSIEPLQGMGQVNYSAVCRESSQQDHLLDVVKRFGATKIVFSGCSVESLPIDYIDSLRFLGCSTRTLNLAYITNARTDGELIDCELAMAWQLEPWSENSAINRCTKILEDSNISKLMYGDKIPFGLNLQPDEVWITSPSDSLIEKISKLGITVKYFGN